MNRALLTQSNYKLLSIIVLAILLVLVQNSSFAQDIKSDTLKLTTTDSIPNNDSALKVSNDKFKDWGIKISPDAPESKVVSTAKDSAIFDMESNMFYLYGDANITQDDLELKSGVVAFDQKNNIVSAYPLYDTAQKITSEQSFKQGEETFVYDSLRYNFKSKKALVRNARMQYGDAYINSFQVKRNPDQSIYGYKNVYTTCNREHPHFGISAKKIKVIPNKVAASGPAKLTIADLPTPLMFPFGIFPINPQQKSGFILPTYNMGDNLGLGLRDIGYYIEINKHIGVKFTFDIYSSGSYGIHAATSYFKKYKYTGDFFFDFSKMVPENEYDLNSIGQQTNFAVKWNHTVDPKAMPGASFNANVDFGTNNNNRINGITANIQTQNTYNSSISYSKNWVGRPFNFTAGLRHNQNTQTGGMSITLPELSFNVSQIIPFQRKVVLGKQKWYEKITTSYNIAAINKYDVVDSNFSLRTLNSKYLSNAIKQSLSLGATYNVLRYINWNFSIPYTEYWNTKQQYYTYNPSLKKDDTTTNNGFFASRDFSVNSSLSTRIYGMLLFKKGKLAGIRHVVNPSLNFNYTPGFAQPPYEYFATYYNNHNDLSYRSYYQNSPYGGPGNALPIGSVGLSINNNLQIKVRTKDSVGTKNITILDGLGISANYNFFADSNNLSNISFNGRTNINNNISITFGGSFDPYFYNDSAVRTKNYLIDQGGPIAKLRNFSAGLNLNLNGPIKKKDNQVDEDRKNNQDLQRMTRNNGLSEFYDFNIPWNINISTSIDYRNYAKIGGYDSSHFSPTLTLNGSLRFTPKMLFTFGTGYDFENKKPGASTFSIIRDLHCWQMSLNMTPFGVYRNYNFTLNVKSSVLQDLKLTRRRMYQDFY